MDLRLVLLVLVATIAICSLIDFAPETETNGLSWFGVRRQTVVPFGLGVLCVVALLVRAAATLPDSSRPLVMTRRALVASAVLMLGLLATPYTLSTFFNWAHMTFGATLFAMQLAYAGWFAATYREPVPMVLALAQLVAGLVAAASLVGVVDQLFTAQVVFQVAYGVVLPLAVARLLADAGADAAYSERGGSTVGRRASGPPGSGGPGSGGPGSGAQALGSEPSGSGR